MKDKVIIITGASSGIGEALARLVAREGATLTLAARRREALEAVARACGGDPLVAATDVTRREEVRRLIEQTLTRFGRIDILVNNAGQGISRVPSLLSDEDIDAMVSVNIKSVLYGMQEVLPHFRSRNAGHIVNISSLLGRIPFTPIRSAYTGAKHFMNALTASLRAEVQETHPGIQISLVSPGVVQTDFGLKAMHGGPDSRSLPYSQSVEEVAAVIADVMRSRLPDVYTRKGSQAQVASYYATVGVDP